MARGPATYGITHPHPHPHPRLHVVARVDGLLGHPSTRLSQSTEDRDGSHADLAAKQSRSEHPPLSSALTRALPSQTRQGRRPGESPQDLAVFLSSSPGHHGDYAVPATN